MTTTCGTPCAGAAAGGTVVDVVGVREAPAGGTLADVAGGRVAPAGGTVADADGIREAPVGGTLADVARGRAAPAVDIAGGRDAPDADPAAAPFVWDTWRGGSTDDGLAAGRAVVTIRVVGESESRIGSPCFDVPALTGCSAPTSWAVDKLAFSASSYRRALSNGPASLS